MITALQLAINALALGAAYALVALGFVLVLNATSAVNFAQGDMVMAGGYVAIALAGALLIAGQSFVMARTQFGRRLRATAQDRETARALGIRVTAMIAASFAIGAALAGTAGLLLANQFFVTPSAGTDFVIKAYIATT